MFGSQTTPHLPPQKLLLVPPLISPNFGHSNQTFLVAFPQGFPRFLGGPGGIIFCETSLAGTERRWLCDIPPISWRVLSALHCLPVQSLCWVYLLLQFDSVIGIKCSLGTKNSIRENFFFCLNLTVSLLRRSRGRTTNS